MFLHAFIFLAFFSFHVNANAMQGENTVPVARIIGATAALVTLSLISSNIIYRRKVKALKEDNLSENLKKIAKQFSLYQTVGTTETNSKRKTIFDNVQKEIVVIHHKDFHIKGSNGYDNAFFDPATGLIARVFLDDENNAIMTFRGSEQYFKRLQNYNPSSYKAIEWAEAVYDQFGVAVNYVFVGHCAGGSHAMLAGYNIHHISQKMASIEVYTFNSSIPFMKQFLHIRDNKEELKLFLKNSVMCFQNKNDPVFCKVGLFIPFVGCWNWYNSNSEVSQYIKNYRIDIPSKDKKNISASEKYAFYRNFSFFHKLNSEDTWQHSVIKWLNHLFPSRKRGNITIRNTPEMI